MNHPFYRTRLRVRPWCHPMAGPGPCPWRHDRRRNPARPASPPVGGPRHRRGLLPGLLQGRSSALLHRHLPQDRSLPTPEVLWERGGIRLICDLIDDTNPVDPQPC